MQIGVGVISRPENTRMLEKILADKSLTSSVDFISYHNYEWLKEPSDLPLEKILQKHNVSLPIFLTEWSHTPNIKQSDAYVLTDQAISYAGSKLVVFTRTGFGWQAWCGFKQQTFCDGTFNWLPMDKPEPEDGRHVNDGMQQWAFYPNGTTMVTFGYTCKRKKSK
jgi:hypothetical protein